MSGSQARMKAIAAVTKYKAEKPGKTEAFKPEKIYGANVFSEQVMKEMLPKDCFKSLKKTMKTGAKLDPAVADAVAAAMKEWALSKGATHYTHVFFPLTGLTAEKHDSFLAPDGKGGAIAEFEGKQLIQGEPDASSFPSGGLRSTFEARGYTAWDVTSPAYIMESPNGTTLCIPTAFVSWTGEALDKKTPLLRSLQALDKQAKRVLKILGKETTERVTCYAGPEQEYFLIDRNFFFSRPDLYIAGRSLFGAKPPKGQEFEDQYFGAIPRRVLNCMMEVEEELYKMGIPVKTRHNEVAPSQYEIAPIYEEGNVATDHNQMVMHTLRRVAKRYGLACLLHEKPFAGINGSGKHLNYSIGNSELGSLFDPGDTPHENMQFLVFCAAAIRAMHKYGGMLRATVATAGNDHRLGANEAPPAIMSVYLGEMLTDVFTQIKNGGAKSSKAKGVMNVGVDTLPPLPMDPGDRNRTSPFAFTGNRFEFRAVGSAMSVAGPQVALNAMMAESLDFIATTLEKKTGGDPKKVNAAVQEVLQDIMRKHDAIIFNGDGYSEAWHKEAEKRGLPNFRNTPEALSALTTPEALELFTKYGVFYERELRGRQDIYTEYYCRTLKTESALVVKMAKTTIYPAALQYQNDLAGTGSALEKPVKEKAAALLDAVAKLEKAMAKHLPDLVEEAKHLCNVVLPAMNDVRAVADELEGLVADDLWPLPSYMEMLFIK